ncbi:hypothetical protein D3C72_2013840 [compost metagenome]
MPIRQAAKQRGNHLLHRRHTRGAAYQHQAVEVLGADPGIPQRLLNRRANARQQHGPDFQRPRLIQRPFAVFTGTVPAQLLLALAQLALELLNGIGKAGQGLWLQCRGLQLPIL